MMESDASGQFLIESEKSFGTRLSVLQQGSSQSRVIHVETSTFSNFFEVILNWKLSNYIILSKIMGSLIDF